jgi:hypothetical protein
MSHKILIMGASYGSLLGTKLALAGHSVDLVCLPPEAELINNEGAVIRIPVRGREGLVEINSKKLPGKMAAGGTTAWCWRCRSRNTAHRVCASCCSRWPNRASRACRS